ncbi:MAG: energy-coupling factor transporter transmembrane component T [Nitrospirota bacterium]|mgnify:CR=1 FL=1
MEIPEWLKKQSGVDSRQSTVIKRPKENFLDKTLRHVLSFTEDIMFNETVSAKRGILQGIEPRLKILSLIIFIIVLSLQRSIAGILIFLIVSLSLMSLSGIPLTLFLKRLLPVFLFTTIIAFPASFSFIVNGDPLLFLYRSDAPHNVGPIEIPAVISLTRQGVFSALTLIFRVITSVSILFLITLTTPPNRLIKTITYFMPGTLKSIVSVSYRYIFFLVQKVEQLIMGIKSRSISAVSVPVQQRLVASRIGLLFSLSLRLSNDLERAMEARGYNYKFEVKSSKFKVKDFSGADTIWVIVSIIFAGVMLWKSLE